MEQVSARSLYGASLSSPTTPRSLTMLDMIPIDLAHISCQTTGCTDTGRTYCKSAVSIAAYSARVDTGSPIYRSGACISHDFHAMKPDLRLTSSPEATETPEPRLPGPSFSVLFVIFVTVLHPFFAHMILAWESQMSLERHLGPNYPVFVKMALMSVGAVAVLFCDTQRCFIDVFNSYTTLAAERACVAKHITCAILVLVLAALAVDCHLCDWRLTDVHCTDSGAN